MILNALAEQLRRRAKGGFKGRHFEATLILQAVSWCVFVRGGPPCDRGLRV